MRLTVFSKVLSLKVTLPLEDISAISPNEFLKVLFSKSTFEIIG